MSSSLGSSSSANIPVWDTVDPIFLAERRFDRHIYIGGIFTKLGMTDVPAGNLYSTHNFDGSLTDEDAAYAVVEHQEAVLEPLRARSKLGKELEVVYEKFEEVVQDWRGHLGGIAVLGDLLPNGTYAY